MNPYTPKVYNNGLFESITTPNKNITSYFMKSDNSFLVKDSERFKNYYAEEDEILTILISLEDIIIGKDLNDLKILCTDKNKYSKFLSSENLQESQIITNVDIENSEATSIKTIDELSNAMDSKRNEDESKSYVNSESIIKIERYSIVEDKEIFKDLFVKTHFNRESLSSIQILQNVMKQTLKSLYKIPKSSFICLVFNDSFNRTEVVALIDMLMNLFGSKGILLLPMATSISISRNIGNYTLVNGFESFYTISFVEDFCLINTTCVPPVDESNIFQLEDNNDFVEEFNNPGFKTGFVTCICSICKEKFEKENIHNHLKEKHFLSNQDENTENLNQYFHEEREIRAAAITDNLTENICVLTKNNFTDVRMQKLIQDVLCININQKVDNSIIKSSLNLELEVKTEEGSIINAFLGGVMFSDMECSKECWITDKEWANGRLRILKEKLLFYI